jgi:hypothetical protein
VRISERLFGFLGSTPNWIGLGMASIVLVLKGMGLVGTPGLALAVMGYVAGFVAAGMWFGFPSFTGPAWEALHFSDEGDAREAMERALHGVRGLTQYNPENRLPDSLQARVLELCNALEALLQQWERSRGRLSLENSFDARRIAIIYLPEALNAYLSIPASFARTRLLANGKTALDTFDETIVELEGKVCELADDLASQDAQAFLAHSQFLKQKFGDNELSAAAALNLPSAKDKIS